MKNHRAKQLTALRDALFTMDPVNVDGGFFDRTSAHLASAERAESPVAMLAALQLLGQELQQYSPSNTSQALGEAHQEAFKIATALRIDLEGEISGR